MHTINHPMSRTRTHPRVGRGVDERSREETLARTTARLASLLARLSVEAEKGTRNIIRLTWAVVVLAVALFLLTGYLCCEAYQKSDFRHVRHSIVIE